MKQLDGIYTIQLPLPGYSSLGTANIYLLTAQPVTLIDTGPKYPGSFEFVKEKINEAGLDTRDIERILITHSHVDHFGLVKTIREDAGRPIPCYVHNEDLWRLGKEAHQEMVGSGKVEKLAAMAGLPDREMKIIMQQFSLFDALCDIVEDAIGIEEGDRFYGADYDIRVIHTPGHTPGNCCFYESERKILFSGDHILKQITPNPVYPLMKERIRDKEYKSLKAYRSSLDKVEALDVACVMTGHGEPVEDLHGLIQHYREHHRDREEKIWRALHKKPRPLYHIFDEVFDSVPENDILLAVSELLVHLETLAEAGRVALAEPGPPALYRAIGEPS